MDKYKLSLILPGLLLGLLFNSSLVLAEMYKWVDENGNISYSDQPPHKSAKTLEAPELSSVPATKIPKKKPVEPEAPEDEPTKYSSIKIISPKDDTSIQNNAGNIVISFSIKPALNTEQGHYFSVSMDGKVMQDKLTSSTASLSNIDRGTHKISVSVKNKKGQTLRKSKVIIVHLHRHSILKNKQNVNPSTPPTN